MLVLLPIAALAFLIVNVLTIMCFWYDKRRAIAGERTYLYLILMVQIGAIIGFAAA